MAISPHDLDPDGAPDVTCDCGAVVAQAQPYSCLACQHTFEVACTSKGFWMWVRPITSTDCPKCGSASTQFEPCRLHRTCPRCGKDEVVKQGI